MKPKNKDLESLNHYLEKLNNSPMLPHNKTKILEYYNEKVANGVKKISYTSVIRTLTLLSEAFKDKKFEDATKQEMVEYINNLKPGKRVLHTRHGKVLEFKPRPFSEKTLWQYKATIKTFYRWLFGIGPTDTAPDAVRWIRREGGRVEMLADEIKKHILTIREVNTMINFVKNPRDKALLAILWETGLRASELLGMKKSDLEWHNDYVEFEVSGKTGKREVILVQSKPHLEQWLNHLDIENKFFPEEFKDEIWLTFKSRGLDNKNFGNKALTRDNLNSRLKTIAKSVGIKKRVWTHGLRHSAATKDAANGWNEAKLRIKYGWSGSSIMPSVYTHLANSDLKETILEENGIIEHKDKKEKSLLENTIKCMFCFTANLSQNDYCTKCGKPIKAEQFKALEKKAEVTDVLQEMIRQELEKKGIDLGEVAKILAVKAK